MNITEVLNEMKLNEGYFVSSKYKDKEKFIDAAKNFMQVIFSEKLYNDILFGLKRTKFRNMSTREEKKEVSAGYANTVDIDAFEHSTKKLGVETKMPKTYNLVRNKIYKRATKSLDHQKIFLNRRYWNNNEDTEKILLLTHEMIHVVQPYTPELRKASEDLYQIFKRNWAEDSGDFLLSKILTNNPDDEAIAGRKSEIIPYLISDGWFTMWLTEEGVKEAVEYLKRCDLLNVNDEFGFWDIRFKGLVEQYKEGNRK